jgi:hypothetical protein
VGNCEAAHGFPIATTTCTAGTISCAPVACCTVEEVETTGEEDSDFEEDDRDTIGVCSNVPSLFCTQNGGNVLTSPASCPTTTTPTSSNNPCRCCLTVEKFCLARRNKDGHNINQGNNWGDIFSANWNDQNNNQLQDTTSCNFRMGDTFVRNHEQFVIDDNCEFPCDDCRNETFVIRVTNHCNVPLEFDVFDFVDENEFLTISPSDFNSVGANAQVCGFVSVFPGNDMVNHVVVNSTSLGGVEGCVATATATFEIDEQKSSGQPFQSVGPSWGPFGNAGGQTWSPPGAPFQQRPGAFPFGRR